jgi:hypothetical protein
MVPRKMGAAIRLKSSLLGNMLVTLLVNTSRCSFCSRLLITSAKPNTPIATATKPMPSESSGMPNAKRDTPLLTSVPTTPPSRPRQIMAMALISEPEASTTAPIMPSTMSEKYSAGPNLNATSASGTAKAASSKVPTQPATKEPSAAVVSATPPRPRRAIW